ncbi:MAG: hypothetical protein ACRD4B_01835 [Acidobacteriota bacterium]
MNTNQDRLSWNRITTYLINRYPLIENPIKRGLVPIGNPLEVMPYIYQMEWDSLLERSEKSSILQVGFGLGFYTAVLAELNPRGIIIATESNPETFEKGQEALRKYLHPSRVEWSSVYHKIVSEEYPDLSLFIRRTHTIPEYPFDRIILHSAVPLTDDATNILKHLKPDGIAIVPVAIPITLKEEENRPPKEKTLAVTLKVKRTPEGFDNTCIGFPVAKLLEQEKSP